LVVPDDPIVNTTISNIQPEGILSLYLQYAVVGCNTMLIVNKYKDINYLFQKFRNPISTESDSTEKWSEFIRGDNNIYHCDPDIYSILKNCIVESKEYNQNKIKVLTNFFKAKSANRSLAPLAEMTVDCCGKPSLVLYSVVAEFALAIRKKFFNACVLVHCLSLKNQ
jgi:hypothetical protein